MLRFTNLKGGRKAASAVSRYVEAQRQPVSEKDIRAALENGEPARAIGYYSESGGAPARWLCDGREYFGDNRPDGAKVEQLLSGITTDGEDISGRGNQEQNRRIGFDLTFSAPKSVSILGVQDERILQAHDAAIQKAMEHAKTLAYARIGKGGERTEYTGNLIAAAYRHEDDRAVDGHVDPHLHTHVIVPNMTKRGDGQWVALRFDFGEDNKKQLLLDSIYKAELAHTLKSFGYGIERTKDGFEIAGVTREQIEKFSRRSDQILDRLKKGRSEATAAEREGAQNITRAAKLQKERADQHFEWRQRLREAGVDADKLRNHDRTQARDAPEIAATRALDAAIADLSERETVISRADLERAALDYGMGEIVCTDLQTAMQSHTELLDAGAVDRDGTGKLDHRFTTLTALKREQDILSRAQQGKGQAAPIFAPADPKRGSPQPHLFSLSPANKKEQQHHESQRHENQGHFQPDLAGPRPLSQNHLRGLSGRRLDADEQRQDPGLLPHHALDHRHGHCDVRRPGDGRPESPGVAALLDAREDAQGWKFSQGQRAAIDLALTSPDRHLGIVGAAGAGKTTSMKVIVDEYHKAGWQVIGVAPSAAAAKELESAGCNETRTLASLLAQKEPYSAKTLYLLDEAGMVSAKDFQAFLVRADKEGVRTICVGDPRQLQAVEAGNPFKHLLESGAIDHVKIDEIQRQKDPQLKAIAEAFSRGDAKQGIKLARPYMTTVEVLKGEDRSEHLAEAAAARYLALSPEDRGNTLLLAGTNKTRQAINEKVRDSLTERGELDRTRTTTITALDKSSMTKEQMRHARNYERGMVIDVGGKNGPDYRTVDHTKGDEIIDDRRESFRPGKVRGVYLPREMQLAEGEQIMLRQNDRQRGITNGSTAAVHILDGQVMAHLKDGTVIPLKSTEVLDYDYARTVHQSQGATFDRAIVVAEGSRVESAEAAYVACSRERFGLEILTADPQKLEKQWQKFAARETAHQALGLEQTQADKLQDLRAQLPDLDRQAQDKAQEQEKAIKAQQQQQERARQAEIAAQREAERASRNKGLTR